MRSAQLTISLDTLLQNARAIRARIPEGVRMLAVVKADAYGHGAVPFALALEREGIADWFAVAMAEEGIALREAGVRGHILVLGGADEASLREGVSRDLSQCVYRREALDVLADEAEKRGKRARAHLKLDTGMTRIGVRSLGEIEPLLDRWKELPQVDMEGCFTHFCVADTDPDFTGEQNRRFSGMLERVRAAGFSPIAHAAATSAMLRPEYQYDMVRAGIGLYGSCLPELADGIAWAQTVSARPVRIERVPAGETVSYGRTCTLSRDTLVATVPVGYGDGYPRILGNRAHALVRGVRVPVIGRVCMDMLMLDVTDVGDVSCEDEVVLLGPQGAERISPDELAELSGTIPYEIMLGFHPRLKRIIAE